MIWFSLCMAIAAVLAALAAFYRPASPPPVSLLALAVAFMALAWLLQALLPG